MGRASRKIRGENLLQQYRDAGWDEESLRIWFGGQLPDSKKASSFFRHPREIVSSLMSGKHVSPAQYGEVLERANWNADPESIAKDPVFQRIFAEELRRLGEKDSWIDDFDQDLLCQKFVGLLGPQAPRLLEAAAEIDPTSFIQAAKDIKSRKTITPWAREEFASGLTRILEKQGSREWSAARHQYLRAVWGVIRQETGEAWPLQLEWHFSHIKSLLRRGAGNAELFESAETAEGLLAEEALLRDAVQSFIDWGVLQEKMDKDTARMKVQPLLSRQIFSQLLQRPVTDTQEAADEIAAQYFFPGVRRKEVSGSPFDNLQPFFRAENKNKDFALLQTAYLQNRVWPTRDRDRNATKLLEAIDGASADYLDSDGISRSWSELLADHIQRRLMR